MPNFKKGSQAAKDYMASIRKLKGKPKAKRTAKKVGAIKIVEKGETKLTKPTKVYQQIRTKTGAFKLLKRIAGTKKTTVSGIQKTISGMQKTYMALYQNKGIIIGISTFKASSLLEARKYASAHKKHTPQWKKYKSITTSVKLYKN